MIKNNSPYYRSKKIFNSETNKLKLKHPVFVTSLFNLKNEGDYVLFHFYGEEYIASKSKKKIEMVMKKLYVHIMVGFIIMKEN